MLNTLKMSSQLCRQALKLTESGEAERAEFLDNHIVNADGSCYAR